MSPEEANTLLTKAALVDPRLKRVSVQDQADMAEEWAAILPDVDFTDALSALHQLQRSRRATDPAIQPGDILAELGIRDEATTIPDVTSVWLEAQKYRVLAEAGVTEQEWRDHATDRAWLEAHFPSRAIANG